MSINGQLSVCGVHLCNQAGTAIQLRGMSAAKELPLFVSEFGSQTFTGDGANDFVSTTAWLDLLKSNKISYGMWSFSDGRETNSTFKQGTCAGATFTGNGVPTEAGRYLRSRILTGVGNPNG